MPRWQSRVVIICDMRLDFITKYYVYNGCPCLYKSSELGWWLDSVMWVVFSNLHDPVIWGDLRTRRLSGTLCSFLRVSWKFLFGGWSFRVKRNVKRRHETRWMGWPARWMLCKFLLQEVSLLSFLKRNCVACDSTEGFQSKPYFRIKVLKCSWGLWATVWVSVGLWWKKPLRRQTSFCFIRLRLFLFHGCIWSRIIFCLPVQAVYLPAKQIPSPHLSQWLYYKAPTQGQCRWLASNVTLLMSHLTHQGTLLLEKV